jgi:hypothetical protein
MFILNNRKVSIDAPVTHNGVTYPNLRDPLTRTAIGVVEKPDPVYPDPDLFYWTENADGSLAITPKSDEQIAQQKLSKAAQDAQRYLNDTDYLFAVDRHARLQDEEPARAVELLIKREEAREAVRLFKASQVKL